jgi:hypothetical protein
MEKSVGSIVVTENGNVVLLTALDQQGEVNAGGQIGSYDFGIVLRGTTHEPGEGIRLPYPKSESVRVAAYISQALQTLEQSGVDLRTRPEPQARVAR